MLLSGALTILLALGAGGDDRLLLCRPEVVGDPASARAEAVGQAARKLRGKFLDYGAECKDPGEGARAARRAGLAHAVVARAEGSTGGSLYELILADADAPADADADADAEAEGTAAGIRAKRRIEVKLAADAVPPVKGALKELLETLPPKPGPDPQHVAAWTVVGVGAAAAVAGVVLSAQADRARERAQGSGDANAYQREKKRSLEKQKLGNLMLGVGGAAIAGGLTWRFVF